MHPVNELDSGRWANPNPSQCECRGGWLLSDYDTWHRCPLHGRGVPHPEEEVDFDYRAHSLRVHREAWIYFRVQSGMAPRAFREAVAAHVRTRVRASTFAPTPTEWVDFADEVAGMMWQDEANRRAVAQGYSCRLEAAWAAEAAFEHGCHERRVEPETEAYGPLAADRDSWYRN